MYENVTYEDILQRMLDRVPSNMDKREGSIIYDALAPAAVELQNMYIELDTMLNETFADTASRDYLIKRASERGITPKLATYSILKGEFNIDVPINSRFGCNDLNYVVVEKISSGVYKMRCETVGSIGNKNLGDLIPIDYIANLTSAQLTELLIPGDDDEETEALRDRYFDSLDSQAFGGNIADYKEKTKSLSGVGGVKVVPVWNGGGTVKLIILDSTFNVPSSTLIDSVQTAIDPIQNSGQGVGLAPIGHVVTVVGVESVVINLTANLTYQSGWSWGDVKEYVEQSLDKYYLELSQTWEDADSIIVRISQIENRILNCPGIIDIENVKLNDSTSNLTLASNYIPIRGDFNG